MLSPHEVGIASSGAECSNQWGSQTLGSDSRCCQIRPADETKWGSVTAARRAARLRAPGDDYGSDGKAYVDDARMSSFSLLLVGAGLLCLSGCSSWGAPPAGAPHSTAPTPPPPIIPTTSSAAAERPKRVLIDFSEAEFTFAGRDKTEFGVEKADVVLPPHAGRTTAMKSEPRDKCSEPTARFAIDGDFLPAPGAERLYVLQSDCDTYLPGLHFVILAADGSESDAGRAEHPSVVHAEDVNGDGLIDLIVSGARLHQGTYLRTAQLGSFSTGNGTVLRDLGVVLKEDCGGYEWSAATETALVVFQTHRELTTLTAKEYEQPCNAGKKWKFARDVKLVE